MDTEYKILKMPFGQYTKDGAFYINIGGHNVGFNNRTHWETEAQAHFVAKAILNEIRQATNQE